MTRVIISEKSPNHAERWSRFWNIHEVTDGTKEVEGVALYQSSNKAGFSTGQLLNDKLDLQCRDKVEVDIIFAESDFSETLKRTGVSLVLDKPMKENMHYLDCAAYFSNPHLSRFYENWFYGEPRTGRCCTVIIKLIHIITYLNSWTTDHCQLHYQQVLQIANWHNDVLKSIPDDFFDQPRLVILQIRNSKLVQVWEGSKLGSLKILNLSYCRELKKSPNFSNLPNLEELILEWCESLSEIHPSIGHLKKLSLVNLKGCKNLISLPGDFYKSKSVQTLVLDFCWQFSELPEDLGKMISLRVLEASATAIRQVPRSTVRLKNLTHLSLAVMQLKLPLQFPNSLHGSDSVRNLDFSWCIISDDALPSLTGLSNLESLRLNNCISLHTLPSFSGLSNLESLRLSNCHNLRAISDLPTNLKFLDAFNCSCLVTMPKFSKMSSMRELDVHNSHALTEVPDLDKSLNSMTWIDTRDCPKLTADFMRNVLKGQISNDKLNLQSRDKVDITFEMPKTLNTFHYVSIKGTGVNLVWGKPMRGRLLHRTVSDWISCRD
ncbi:disease resistance protein RUN1-like [Pyrus communis]|uniref:disease resistance protein RUN1-like n=1 Tax=Pyrus communis TaxID=23211 RepID=UPI0035BFA5C1